MTIDLKSTEFSLMHSEKLAPGATVSDEGQALVSVLHEGISKVKPSTGSSGEVFVGFAVFRQLSYSTAVRVESVTVPSASPLTNTLSSTNLVASSIRARAAGDSVDLTIVESTSATPSDGEVVVNLTTGGLKFHADETGKAVTFYYTYNLTVAAAKAAYGEATTNQPDANLMGDVTVGRGKGRIFTSCYDTAINWETVTAGTIKLGPNGKITTAGSGSVIPGARVIRVPTAGVTPQAGAQMLGIEFNA